MYGLRRPVAYSLKGPTLRQSDWLKTAAYIGTHLILLLAASVAGYCLGRSGKVAAIAATTEQACELCRVPTLFRDLPAPGTENAKELLQEPYNSDMVTNIYEVLQRGKPDAHDKFDKAFAQQIRQQPVPDCRAAAGSRVLQSAFDAAPMNRSKFASRARSSFVQPFAKVAQESMDYWEQQNRVMGLTDESEPGSLREKYRDLVRPEVTDNMQLCFRASTERMSVTRCTYVLSNHQSICVYGSVLVTCM